MLSPNKTDAPSHGFSSPPPAREHICSSAHAGQDGGAVTPAWRVDGGLMAAIMTLPAIPAAMSGISRIGDDRGIEPDAFARPIRHDGSFNGGHDDRHHGEEFGPKK